MSERYVPPPPPYELSIQHDRKVTEELEALKESPYREEEWNDSKHPKVLSDKTLKDTVAVHTLPGNPKYQVKSDNAGPRARRPLPPRPVDARPQGPQGQGSRFRSSADINPYAVQNYHATERHTVASPSFPVITPRLDEPSYLHSIHQSTSVEPAPLYYPPQSSHDTPCRESGDRWPGSVGSSIEPTSLRRSSTTPLQSPSYPLSQNDNVGSRLLFDPSVAYSASQANRTTFSARRGAAASFYSSAVSSHLSLDSTHGPRQSYIPARPALPTSRDKTDVQSIRSLPARSSDLSSIISYTSQPRPSSGYEQRWAASASDFTSEKYRG